SFPTRRSSDLNNRVVEGGLDMSDPMRNIFPLFFLEGLLLAFCCGACAGCCCLCHFYPSMFWLLSSSCWRLCLCVALCGCAHWYGCAVREREGHGGDGTRDRTRFRSAA